MNIHFYLFLQHALFQNGFTEINNLNVSIKYLIIWIIAGGIFNIHDMLMIYG